MKINRPLVALLALMATGCVSQTQPQPPRPAPVQGPPAPAPALPSPPPTQAEPPVDWRDAPLTAGEWRYGVEGSATVAVFDAAQGGRLFLFACHRERGTITLMRSGMAQGAVPMSLVTTFGVRPYSLQPTAPQALSLALPARDPALDEVAYSRGRIAIEVNGLPTLYLPARAEIGRVIEDCR